MCMAMIVQSVIENKENPFRKDVTQQILHIIMTQEVMTDEIQNQLLQVKATGTAAYENLRKERFVEESAQIFRTIHRTNLKTFKSIRALQMAKRLQESHKYREEINIGSMSLKLPVL